MGRVARVLLIVCLGLVAGVGLHVQRAARLERGGSSWSAGHGEQHRSGTVEGRVALDGPLEALLARPDVPRLEARAAIPGGVARVEVEDNGRFLLDGLPAMPVDIELVLGGERLASVREVMPGRPFEPDGQAGTALDPRLDGIALAGPLHVLELVVETADHRPVDSGWLAWRRTGEGPYASVVPVVAGAATIVTVEPVVDVLALLPGLALAPRACVFHGDRLVAEPGPSVRAMVPEVPPGVALRLEAAHAPKPAALDGEAALRASEVQGGWAKAGVAEVPLIAPGRVGLRWVAYGTVGERVTRLPGFTGRTVEVEVGPLGPETVDVPLPRAELDAAYARFEAEEGLRRR